MLWPMLTPEQLRLAANLTVQQLSADKVADVFGVPSADATLRGLVDGAIGGTVNDAVLQFDASNDVLVGDALEIVHDADLGDSVTVNERGIYLATFVFSQAASSDVRLGISTNVATDGLTEAPSMTTEGMKTVGGASFGAGNTAYQTLSAVFTVRQADVEETGVSVRAQGTTAAGDVIPDASVDVNDDCFLRVTRIADILE